MYTHIVEKLDFFFFLLLKVKQFYQPPRPSSSGLPYKSHRVYLPHLGGYCSRRSRPLLLWLITTPSAISASSSHVLPARTLTNSGALHHLAFLKAAPDLALPPQQPRSHRRAHTGPLHPPLVPSALSPFSACSPLSLFRHCSCHCPQ